MIEKQKARFQEQGVQQIIENYVRDPTNNEKAYMEFL